jgi:hypothetical protein
VRSTAENLDNNFLNLLFVFDQKCIYSPVACQRHCGSRILGQSGNAISPAPPDGTDWRPQTNWRFTKQEDWSGAVGIRFAEFEQFQRIYSVCKGGRPMSASRDVVLQGGSRIRCSDGRRKVARAPSRFLIAQDPLPAARFSSSRDDISTSARLFPAWNYRRI